MCGRFTPTRLAEIASRFELELGPITEASVLPLQSTHQEQDDKDDHD
jgi:hypothetical protein